MGTTTVISSITSGRTATTTLTRMLTYGSIVVADLLGLTAAGAFAVLTRYIFHGQFSPSDWASFAPGILIFLFVFAVAGLYPGVATSPIDEFRLILRSSSLSFLILICATFFLREGLLSSRIVFMLAWFATIVLVPSSRRFVRGWCSTQTWWGIPTVIMGEPIAGRMMLDLLEGHRRVGLRPVALLVENSLEQHHASKPDTIFSGDISLAKSLAKEYRDCYAVIAMPNSGSDRIKAVFNDYAQHYRNVLIIPDLFGMRSLSVSAKDICGVLTLEVDQTLTLFLPQLIKRTFDLTISIGVALVLSPVLLVLAILVRLSSRGPIFYGQQRIGRHEEPFKVWKFRSMVVDADDVLKEHLEKDPLLREEWERDHKLKRDPRVTIVGRILRKTSLDELPQLWNVISGEMSLVGPRPIVRSEIAKYGPTFGQYQRVTPGVTGLWQISGRNNTTYELRTRIDDYYVRNWSFSLDIYILFRTLKTIFFSEGAY
jgi:Undecaprenyl-phosphate galactose phosphotransferase WbaP